MTVDQLTSSFPSAMIVLDPAGSERLRKERARFGSDKWDEVWEGTYVMSPLPNNEHQAIVSHLVSVFREILGWSEDVFVFPGTNVTDQEDDWEKNYRCPDVAVFLPGTKAENRDTHWFGGPDFLVEVVSQNDQTRKKLPFYAKVGTREMVIVDRQPGQNDLMQTADPHNASRHTATRRRNVATADRSRPR